MAAAARVEQTQPEAPQAPDMSKPVALRYWQQPDSIGTLTQRNLTVDGTVADGTTSGRVRAIWFYPQGGYAVAEIEVGFRPGQLEQKLTVRKLFLSNGHGVEL